jgi:hypothetical protein
MTGSGCGRLISRLYWSLEVLGVDWWRTRLPYQGEEVYTPACRADWAPGHSPPPDHITTIEENRQLSTPTRSEDHKYFLHLTVMADGK